MGAATSTTIKTAAAAAAVVPASQNQLAPKLFSIMLTAGDFYI